MSSVMRGFGGAALLGVSAVAFMFGQSGWLMSAVALFGALVMWGSTEVWRRRPERIAIGLALLAVGGGSVVAVVHVVDGISDRRVEYRAPLDVPTLRGPAPPPGPLGANPRRALELAGYAYVTDGVVTMTELQASGAMLVLWSVEQLAPWLLAMAVLALLLPILRAAERRDPFITGTDRRLTAIALLLLVGIPVIPLLRYMTSTVGSEGTSLDQPVDPTLTLTVLHFLPGILVLVLANIFHRGTELRELERHTV